MNLRSIFSVNHYFFLFRPNLYKKEEVTPLQAPQLLHQFVERFDQLQEKMGIVLDNNQT